MNKVQVVAEIGINFNGDIDKAKRLIDIAKVAGCDYVKFQKRTPELCVPENQKNKKKIVPWKNEPITYLEYKKDIELSYAEYCLLFDYCKIRDIKMFSSVWDIESAKMMKDFHRMVKIPSAKITDEKLLNYCKDNFEYILISTGMSLENEIERAIELVNPYVVFHTNSVYPTPSQDLNLDYIEWLKNYVMRRKVKYIGYSSHYYGITDAYAAMGKGITWLEKHICESHDDWGSDQKSSLEPKGLITMVKAIRDMEKSVNQGYGPRALFPGEEIKLDSLRNI